MCTVHMKNRNVGGRWVWEMQKGFPPVEEGHYSSLVLQEQGQDSKEIPSASFFSSDLLCQDRIGSILDLV